MTRAPLRLALLAALGLNACAPSRQACLERAGAELRALDAEIAETERALAVGYRAAPRGTVTAGLALCAEDSPVTLCVSGERPLRERVVAVDPRTERARLATLRAERADAAAAVAAAAASCPAA